MLARLEGLDGVRRAETDFSGDHLRLLLDDPDALAAATGLLAEAGYGTQEATGVAVERWYDRASVGELSRVEAGVIADRVLVALRRDRTLDTETARRLRDAVADGLHRCFVETTLTARPSPGLRATAVERSRLAARPVVGDEMAGEVARLVQEDMAQDHTQPPA